MPQGAQSTKDRDRLMASLARDHERLGDCVCALDVVLGESEHDVRGFDEALGVLSDEVNKHFRKEEDWMRRIAYPSADVHKDQHTVLVGTLDDFRRSYRNNPSRSNAYVIRCFIDDWLVNHMEEADKAIEDFAEARESGLRLAP